MRFSIIIPTQDRPALLAVAVKHAMQLHHSDFEVIVSDNSTNSDFRRLNADAMCNYSAARNFRWVGPPRCLSPPEHFEFALDFATGDYIVYLTDKMVVLPDALSDIESILRTSGADIVNWPYAQYLIDDIGNPSGSGTLVVESEFLKGQPQSYDPNAALRFKASCIVSRDKQHTRDYALGKIVFGCYSKELIDRIRAVSGTVFGGATHDYSAMVQALSLARTCVMLNIYEIVFISLPSDQSLGSLTAANSQSALRYFRSFTDGESILSSLPVPGLYASQHNMVAHDYRKFLPLYGNTLAFNETNWLAAIYAELTSESKVWLDSAEMTAQLKLFKHHVGQAGQRFPLMLKRSRNRIAANAERFWRPVSSLINSRVFGRQNAPLAQTVVVTSLDDAIRHVSRRCRRCSV